MTLRSAVLLLLVLAASHASAATLRVPSEYSTIQAAIDAASSGDVVLVSPGTYRGAGNVNIRVTTAGLTIRSESGPDVTVIDGEGRQGVRGLHLSASVVIEGFTVTRGHVRGYSGGAILCGSESDPDAVVTIRNCTFSRNIAGDTEIYTGSGGAIGASVPCVISGCRFIENEGHRNGGAIAAVVACELSDCVFEGNRSYWEAGAALLGEGSRIRRCVFENNSAEFRGGAVRLQAGQVEDCIFTHNNGGYDAGAVLAGGGSSFARCIFRGNAALLTGGLAITNIRTGPAFAEGCTFVGTEGSAIHFAGSMPLTISNCIIANGVRADAIDCEGAAPVVRCTDIAGNPGGDWVGCVAGMEEDFGNFSGDPRFCDAAAGDFTLDAQSPCLPDRHPEGSACGLIGALPEACGSPTAATPVRWGRLKVRFREVR